jgi:hypothetical protein
LTRQRVLLDRRGARLYIAAGALAAACRAAPPPLVPLPLAPADRDAAVAWARTTTPPRPTAVRFRWRYEDAERRWGGRGQARIAPPDSLRFDYVGPLGLGAGAAVVVGDSALWADPEKTFRSLVPAVRMLWASLGVARPPAPDAAVFGLEAGADAAGESGGLWRFVEGGDTLDYRETRRDGRVLEAEWRRAGALLARSRTTFDARARPARARVDFPEERARFELTVVAVDTAAVFDPAIWRRRR